MKRKRKIKREKLGGKSTIAREFWGKMVKCKDCGAEWECKEEMQYFAATTTTNGICPECLEKRTPLRQPINRTWPGRN